MLKVDLVQMIANVYFITSTNVTGVLTRICAVLT